MTVGLGCSILVEFEAGKWEHFRALHFRFFFDFVLKFDHSEDRKSIVNRSYVKTAKLLNLTLIKEDLIVEDEVAKVSTIFNMGLTRITYYLNKAIVGTR